LDRNFGTGAIFSGGPADHVAIRFTGKVTLVTAGTYTFYTTSDDGTQVYVDGVRVVNNDGVHGTANTVSGAVTLAAGAHNIEVRYFDYTSTAEVKVEWSGPNVARQILGKAHVTSEMPASPAAVLWGGNGND